MADTARRGVRNKMRCAQAIRIALKHGSKSCATEQTCRSVNSLVVESGGGHGPIPPERSDRTATKTGIGEKGNALAPQAIVAQQSTPPAFLALHGVRMRFEANITGIRRSP